MKIFSNKFADSTNIANSLYNSFFLDARFSKYFDEDEIADLLYYTCQLYSEDKSQFKRKMNKKEFLEKIAMLLNFMSISEILALKAHELLSLIEELPYANIAMYR